MIMSAGNEDYLNKPMAYKSVKSVAKHFVVFCGNFKVLCDLPAPASCRPGCVLCGLLKQFGDCLGEFFGGGDNLFRRLGTPGQRTVLPMADWVLDIYPPFSVVGLSAVVSALHSTLCGGGLTKADWTFIQWFTRRPY